MIDRLLQHLHQERHRSSLARLARLLLFAAVSVGAGAQAATFALPAEGDIVGKLQVVTVANAETTLLDIARHYDVGFDDIARANPKVSLWVPKIGDEVLVPTEFILPPGPRTGIVVNISQRRLYYFPKARAHEPARVITYPISIAREGWPTPLGATRIVAKYRDPAWLVPRSIQEEHRRQGEPNFPTYFPPGPDNPMGMLALQTGFAGIFIHGTNKPWGVGMRTSHGCLHLYPEDAAELFPIVPVGTPVRIIDEPVLVGNRDGVVYLSSSEPVDEYPNELSASTRAMSAMLPESEPAGSDAYERLDWARMLDAIGAHRIVPVPISRGAPRLEDLLADVTPSAYTHAPYGPDANQNVPPAARR